MKSKLSPGKETSQRKKRQRSAGSDQLADVKVAVVNNTACRNSTSVDDGAPTTTMRQACDECRKRKLKCSMTLPKCDNCQRYGWECKYSPRVVRTPLTRARLTEMETRVSQLEKLLKTFVPGQDIDSLLACKNNGYQADKPQFKSNESLVSVSPVIQTNQDSWASQSRRRPQSISPERYIPKDTRNTISSPMSLTSLRQLFNEIKIQQSVSSAQSNNLNTSASRAAGPPVSQTFFQWYEINTNIDNSYVAKGSIRYCLNQLLYPDLIAKPNVTTKSSVLINNDINQNLTSLPSNKRTIPPLTVNDPLILTKRETTSRYIDSFFSNYYALYPVIDKERFYAQYNDQIQPENMEIWQILLNTVLVLGAWCSKSNISHDTFYFENALSYLSAIVFETGSLDLTIALLLLSQYVLKIHKINTAWTLLGLCTHMATSLGLQRDMNHLPLAEQQVRRAVWWSIYCTETDLCIETGRPSSLPSLCCIDVPLPVNSGALNEQTVYSSIIQESQWSQILNHLLPKNPYQQSVDDFLVWYDEIQSFVNHWPTPPHNDAELKAIKEIQLDWLPLVKFRPYWMFHSSLISLFVGFLYQDQEGDNGVDSDSKSSRARCKELCLKLCDRTIMSITTFIRTYRLNPLSYWYATHYLIRSSMIPLCFVTQLSATKPSWENVKSQLLAAHEAMEILAQGSQAAAQFDAVLVKACSDIMQKENSDIDLSGQKTQMQAPTQVPGQPQIGLQGPMPTQSQIPPTPSLQSTSFSDLLSLWGTNTDESARNSVPMPQSTTITDSLLQSSTTQMRPTGVSGWHDMNTLLNPSTQHLFNTTTMDDVYNYIFDNEE